MRRYLEIHQKCVAQTVQGFGGFVSEDGKFSANSAAWEEDKVIPRGRGSREPRGRRPLVHRQAAGAGRNDRTGHASEGGGSGARGWMFCNVVTGGVAPQPLVTM